MSTRPGKQAKTDLDTHELAARQWNRVPTEYQPVDVAFGKADHLFDFIKEECCLGDWLMSAENQGEDRRSIGVMVFYFENGVDALVFKMKFSC
jgi:hypothetical protein